MRVANGKATVPGVGFGSLGRGVMRMPGRSSLGIGPRPPDAVTEGQQRTIPSARRGFRRGAFPMSFLQRFLERVLRNSSGRMARTSFDDLSPDQLDAHLRVGRYGNFTLTDAVRPSIGLDVIP